MKKIISTRALIISAFLAVFTTVTFAASFARAQSQAGVKVLDEKTRTELALKIQKKVRITVFAYLKDSDSYVVKIEAEPDVGPNTTTLDWLLKGIDNGTSEKEIRRNPAKIVGSLFRLKNDLWLLSDEEIADRRAKNAKK
jgi:hypothetical protein